MTQVKKPLPSLVPIWQPVGYSTNKIAKATGAVQNTLASHTGTLDPMAEGVIIVLTGEERYKKYDLAGWKKTYEFEIMLGLSTDSYDAMGVIAKNKIGDTKKPTDSLVKKILLDFKGPYTQQVPIYSAIKYKGKKLFEHAQAGNKVDKLPTKSGEVYHIELIGSEEKSFGENVDKILDKLKGIKGDFRQEKIIEQWELLKKNTDPRQTVTLLKIRAITSRGLYIRSLSQDICKKLNVEGSVFSLVRTQNGDYTRDKCFTLKDIFGRKSDMLN